MERVIRTAVVGTRFMGRAHAAGIDDLNRYFHPGVRVEKAVLCGVDPAHTEQAAKTLGFSEFSTDYQSVLMRDDIDAVHICTPVFEHFSQAMAALLCKKHVFCEKPLTASLQETESLAYAAGESGVVHQIGTNYRFLPAVILLKKLIDEDRLGRIYHFRGVYAQDWGEDDAALSWRFQKEKAGSGALGDIGTHLVDLALYLCGDVERVAATMRTFQKQRPLCDGKGEGIVQSAAGSESGTVDVDDAFCACAEFASGAIGTFEASRFATGHANDLVFEIDGERGAARFDLSRLNELAFFDATLPRQERGWRTIQCTDALHPYGGLRWPVGHQLGWADSFANEFFAFYAAIARGDKSSPDFGDALRTARVIDAIERATYTLGFEEV